MGPFFNSFCNSFWPTVALAAALQLTGGCAPPAEPPLKPSDSQVVIVFDDPACDGQCDSYGANCIFPTYVCGDRSCESATGLLTVEGCNGAGKCAGYAPTACPNHLGCADKESCLTSCTQPGDCVAGFTCANGACVSN